MFRRVLLLCLLMTLTCGSYAVASVSPPWRADLDALSDQDRYPAAIKRLRSAWLQHSPGLLDAVIQTARRHDSANARLRATLLLADMKTEKSRLALGDILQKDPSEMVRSAAALAFRTYGVAALPFLKQGLLDPSGPVLERSMEIMASMGGTAALLVIDKMEKDIQADHFGVYGLLALSNLSCVRDRRVAAFLLRYWQSGPSFHRAAFVEALGNQAWNPDYTAPPGLPYVGIGEFPVEPGFELRRQDRQALIAALSEALNDPSEEVRKSAKHALVLVIEKKWDPR